MLTNEPEYRGHWIPLGYLKNTIIVIVQMAKPQHNTGRVRNSSILVCALPKVLKTTACQQKVKV